jgi:hypothetical protein
MKIVHRESGKVLWEDSKVESLQFANLYGANLRGANLRGANLRGANLRGADLYGADLRGANLGGANLGGANLGGADLGGADLGGADLRGADLYGADLYGANIIVGGTRSDGYQFLMHKEENGELMIRAGCRYFSVVAARKHWADTRGGTQLGDESLELVDSLVRLAKIIGWEVKE